MMMTLCVITILFTLLPLLLFALNRGGYYKGNAKKYSVSRTQEMENSPLYGKTIIFLGSSVTYGSAAKGESFVEYMQKRDGIHSIKEAVCGTTLVDIGPKSYIARLKTIDKNIQADAFVCQLPASDAHKRVPLGKISKSTELSDFDTNTVTGAMEYIIAYAKETWGCPVIFHTGARYQYGGEYYDAMVNRLLRLQKKWNIGVLDLWNDRGMYIVTQEGQKLYMANNIQPTRAGYRDWWTPKFEAYLTHFLTPAGQGKFPG